MAEEIKEMTTAQRLGKAVVRLRKARGISQENFARGAGIDRRYQGHIENGTRNISLGIIERIATYLEMPISELMAEMEKTK